MLKSEICIPDSIINVNMYPFLSNSSNFENGFHRCFVELFASCNSGW